jgi:Arc/MetJ family transcription regulator
MIDEDGSVISAPVFESQTANYMPMMDLDLLDSLLKRHRLATKNKPLSVLYGVGNELTGAMDILQSIFKAGVLMRLGYTIRNGTEAQLRIAASVGSMASMRHLGPGLRNMAFNATDTLAARTVDRLSLSSGPATVESTVRSLTKVDSEISELQAKYAEIAEQYDKELNEFNNFVPPEDPVFTSAKYTDEEVNLLDQGILPERLGFNSPEYQKAAKAEAKRLADEHRAIIDEDYLAKQEETVSAFGLNDRDVRLLETKGLIPLNKVLAAYKAGRLNADELSAIVSTGRIEAASLDGLGSEAYQFLDEASLRGMAVRNGKSPQQYIEVPWRRQTIDEYVNDGIAQFDSYYEAQTLERALAEYTDEANAWYGENASPVYSPTTPNVQLESDMRVIEKLIDDKRSLADDYFAQLENLKKSESRGEKRKIGKGKWKVKSFTGEDYDFNDALGGQFADIHRANSSAENSFNTLVDDNAGLVSKSLTKVGYGEVKPDAPNYYQAWAHALNYQFRNSGVAMKLMDGTEPADVAQWLKADPEGRIVVKRLGLDPWEINEHVAAVKGFVDSYIPSASLRKTLVESTENAPITPEMLRGIYAGTDGLPTVHGHILEENLTLGSVRNAKNIVNGIFKLIGSMPEDLLARHPLYITMYRDELKRRVDMFEGLNERRLTTQEQADLMAITHKVALRQLKNTLFTIDRKSNLSHYMRLISPFFSAFENTTKTWARIAYEKPQTINRANLIFTSPNRAGIATDENGNPVPPEEASMNDYIWIEVPESLKKVPFIGKGLTSLTEMGIQKKSLDVIFQGEAIHIPVGPYVAVPISEMVKRKPELEKTLSWAIPYGPERSAVRAFLPTWVKRQLTKEDGQSNQQYANTYALIWTTEQHKRREMGQPAATAAEIEKMTDAYYNMRTVANLILPFAPTFQTPYKFYIDQWRQYQEQFGMEAQTKFWQDYGDDFFEFTQSLSKNTTGSFASIGSVGNAKAHADLISELSVIDPKLIGIVTNAGQAYDFSQAAYMWQQANTISPSSSEFYRTRKDPAEAAIDNQRSLGWIKYREVMSQIDSEMQRRGLTNLQSKAASDLASMKKQMVAQLGAENTAWYDDYLDTDGSKTNKVIRGLETIVNNEKFMSQYGDNPTFKSIAVYLEIRTATEAALASRESKSIDAKANADIKFAFESVANKLKQEDIGFGDLYDRWLSYDSVYDAVNSQGVAQ